MRPAIRSLVDLAVIGIAAFLLAEQLGDPVALLKATVKSHLSSFQRAHEDVRALKGPLEGGLELIHACFVLNDFDRGRRLGLLVVAGSGLPLALIAHAVRRSRYGAIDFRRAGSLIQGARILQGWSCTLAGLVVVPVMLIEPRDLLEKWPLAWLAATFIAGLLTWRIWTELSDRTLLDRLRRDY
jgi:hypothetical protein